MSDRTLATEETHRSLGRGLVPALLGLALLLLAGPAAANVAPEATVAIHVRAPEPPGQEGCTIPGIADCGDLVNSTELTGEVEFDIFAQPWPYSPEDQLVSLETTLTWPASWQFVRWEPCNGVDADLVPGSGSATLSAFWSACPHVDEVYLVGRLVMHVDQYGRMQPAWNGVLRVNCPQPVALEAVGIFAEAGVTCDYSILRCSPAGYCHPMLGQSAIGFSSGPGGSLAADIPFTALSATGEPCTYTVQTEASWLAASYEMIDSMHYILHLSCDVTGLPEGAYATRALLTKSPYPSARRCVSVTLEVPATSGVPGDGEPVRQVTTSWGKLKSVMR